MDVTPLALPGLLLLRPKRFPDARGFFTALWTREALAKAGVGADFVQDSYSVSAQAGTLRGLHFQTPPFAQAKLITVLRGRAFDAVVDLRTGSGTFGQAVTRELSAESGEQLFVPRGFAHGFLTLEPDTAVFYKVDAPYSAEHDTGLHFADPNLHIAWPMAAEQVTLSPKDAAMPRLKDISSPF